ncbi:MAG: TIGR02444 family protein [Gammaproteobacteria bacterium]|nr:TIGR02444 family protein [Gammaproteobacteria bacterium]
MNTAYHSDSHIQLDPAELWQYSLDHYAKVDDLLLALQDQYQLNINLFLLCGYAQQQGCAIDEMQLANLVAQCQQWQEQLISPFRALRRSLKVSISQTDYQAMLTMELALEKQQQYQLVNSLPELPTNNPEAQANILSCLIFSGIALEQLTEQQMGQLMTIND